jgi:hypothetical protein
LRHSGKMLMNFGPINKSGGERRLNVAFSRTKHHMAVVSSIEFGDITNDYNDGASWPAFRWSQNPRSRGLAK